MGDSQLERGFGVNTIANKLGWREPLVWAVALEGKDDKECFAELVEYPPLGLLELGGC